MYKLLAWSDSASVSTGFGVVSKHVLTAVHKSGQFNIHQLGINHAGEFVDNSKIPWQIQPARLLDPRDPHGMKMFLKTIEKGDYDLVWVLNDLYVTHEIAKELSELKQAMLRANRKFPKIVYYYPVDCKVIANASGLLDICDVPVCYTQHGRQETLLAKPGLASKLLEMPHGIDTSIYYPCTEKEIREWRQKYFNIDEGTYLIINVNRNSTRKQLPYTMQAFKQFREIVPNSKLYIHTAIRDQGGDMLRAVEDLGLSTKTDILFPNNYSPQNSVSEVIMNRIYNCADMFLSTHLGEGWGLTVGEAMACGVPTLVPDNTCMPQLIGDNEERGYMYECKDEIFLDNSGFRKKGLIPDIVNKMKHVHASGNKFYNAKCTAAVEWAKEHEWSKIAAKWVPILESALAKKVSNNSLSGISL